MIKIQYILVLYKETARRSNPVLARVLGDKKLYRSRGGNSMKQKLIQMIQVTVWLYTDEFIFV